MLQHTGAAPGGEPNGLLCIRRMRFFRCGFTRRRKRRWYVNVPIPSSSDTPLVSAVNVSPSYAVPVIEILPVEASCVLATVISKDAESVAVPSETLNDTV